MLKSEDQTTKKDSKDLNIELGWHKKILYITLQTVKYTEKKYFLKLKINYVVISDC